MIGLILSEEQGGVNEGYFKSGLRRLHISISRAAKREMRKKLCLYFSKKEFNRSCFLNITEIIYIPKDTVSKVPSGLY